jgi:HK97 family phage major capsid protein
MSDIKEVNDHIANIGKAFEEFKKVNDQRLEEVKKGDEARAKELSATLDKISADLDASRKAKEIIEKKFEAQKDRLEILESMADRPTNTVQTKIRNEHKSNFVKWVRSGGQDASVVAAQMELEQKAREVKDVTTGTTTAGGFALPEEISRTVNTLVLKLSQISAHVKNVTVGTTDYKELLTYFANGTASNLYGWAGETTTRSATGTPQLRERTPTWGELYAYATASNWSLKDLFFNVEQWITSAAAEGFAVAQSTAILTGDGSSKPTGMHNTSLSASDDYASPLRSASAYEYIPISGANSSPFTTAGIDFDDVINLTYALNPRYRGNAKFGANTITQGHLRKLKDTQGQYLWQPSTQAGQPDRVLGYELFTYEEMGNPTAANAYPLGFGDWSAAYTLVHREGMEVVRDNVTSAGFTKFYLAKRVGGCVTNNDALKFSKVALS